MAGSVRILYRIVEHNPPTRDDMLSYHALGVPLRVETPKSRRESHGISLYNTLQQARNQALRLRRPEYRAIAELQIPNDAPVTIERTGRRGHHTLWGSPDDILGYVTRVFPLDDATTGETR